MLQNLSLGIIIFLLFNSLNLIKGEQAIGLDTQIKLSITFPLFLLIVDKQYIAKIQRSNEKRDSITLISRVKYRTRYVKMPLHMLTMKTNILSFTNIQ